MRFSLVRTLTITTALLVLSGPAHAQGKSHGKGGEHKDRDRDDRGDDVVRQRESDGVFRRRDGDVIVAPQKDRKVPPGLAKKPGQMPPGQYKKVYRSTDGARVLSDILRGRGYVVTRLEPAGDTRVVFYRSADGIEHRAVVSPGAERLVFTNVPTAILQEVLARLR